METVKLNEKQVHGGKPGMLVNLLDACRKMLNGMFTPEEVEVNCEEDHGRIVRYTYRKVKLNG